MISEKTSTLEHQRPTVLLVDDHIVWRRGLRDVLESAFEIVGEAGEGNEAVQKALAMHPNVVVLDIRMPGMQGVAAARCIKDELPDTGVVMLTTSDEDDDLYASIRAGANGYVLKDDSVEAMCQAVHNAAEGGAYLPPRIAQRVLQGMNSLQGGTAALPKGDAPLTSRETTVLRLLAEGLPHKHIAQELRISPRTVGNHIFSI